MLSGPVLAELFYMLLLVIPDAPLLLFTVKPLLSGITGTKGMTDTRTFRLLERL